MVISRKTQDKENNVEGVRKAKAAPDFSKLHKQWDAKLQKGKAVGKKPLTSVQPFDLTHGKPLAICQIADDDFITSDAAKEKLFECNEMQSMQVSKPKRATIGVVSRYQNPNKEKSGIPRPSFGVTSSTTKKTIIHGPIRPAATPKKTTAMTSNNKKLSASVSSATKNAQNIQGFAVDFQADSNALDSIMNEKGIERLPNTPSYQQASRLSSQFGPVRDTRLNPKKQNRMAPFGRQSVIVGNRERQEFQSQNRSSFNATNQRWSVFSRRDSYSSKPFLMEWLQNLAEESKAKRLAAKQKEQEQKEINKLQTAENSTIDVSGNVHRGSFLFRKTLVGYQGDQHKQSEKSDIVPSTITEDDEGSSTAPATPHRPIPTTSGKDTMSTVKSILKKRTTTLSQATVDSERPRAMRSLTMKGVGTPARQNTMSKLPLPKQQRDQMTVQYDKEKKKSVKWVDEQEKSTIEEPAITTPRNNKSNHNATPRRSPIKTRSSTKTPPSGIKTQHRLTESVSVTPTRSPAASDHKYFTRSKPNVVSENIDLSTSNTDKMTHIPTKSRELSASPVTSSPSRHSPTSCRSHQIKYVMPAEQPMEQRTLPIGNLLDQSNFRTNNFSNKSILNPNKMQESESVIPRKGDDSSKKSWAQVLGEELDPYGNKENRTEEPAKTKKKKKRNFKRCSALEQIYGKNIYLNNEVDSPEAPSTNMTVDSPGWASKLHDSSRPLPALDNKVIGDLMSFNNDDANTDLMDLEDSRFLSIIKASQSQSMMENTGKLHQENPPMQSTLLQTPARDEYREKIEILTPVVDAGQKQPDAPGRRQSTKARTPYKQAMLDILYRTLAEANKKRKDGDETIVDATIVGDIEETLLNDTREDHDVIESQINTKETETSRQGMTQLHQNQRYSPKSNSSISDTMLQHVGNDRKPLNVPNPRSPSLKLFEQSATANGILMESSIQDMSLEMANDSPMPLRGDLTPTSELINKMHPKDTNNECDRVKLESKPGFSAPVPFRVVSDPNTHILKNKDETKALTRPSFSLNAPSLFPAPPLFNNLEKSSKFSAVPNAGSSTSQRSFSTSSKPTEHSARSSFLKPSQFSTSLNNHRSIITSMDELTLTIPQLAVTKSLDVFPAPQLFSSLGHGQKSKFSSTLSQQKNNKNLTQDTNSTLSFALKPSTISVQREQQPLTNQLPSFQATTNQLFSSKPFFGSSLFAAQPLFSGLGGDKKNKFSKLRDTKTIAESMPNINNTLTSYQQPNNSLPTYSSPLKDSATKVTSSTILKPSLISLSKDCSAFRPIKQIPQSNDHQQSPDSPQDIQLNTEIQVYTKMGEEYKDLLHSMSRERIDGAFNPLAKLLMHGDEQHFIPIEGSYCVAR